jgi:hypothetical protein
MTKNGLDIQAISTKMTDNQADLVILFEQVTEKGQFSHFPKFHLASGINSIFGFCQLYKSTLHKTQRSVFCQTFSKIKFQSLKIQ